MEIWKALCVVIELPISFSLARFAGRPTRIIAETESRFFIFLEELLDSPSRVTIVMILRSIIVINVLDVRYSAAR